MYACATSGFDSVRPASTMKQHVGCYSSVSRLPETRVVGREKICAPCCCCCLRWYILVYTRRRTINPNRLHHGFCSCRSIWGRRWVPLETKKTTTSQFWIDHMALPAWRSMSLCVFHETMPMFTSTHTCTYISHFFMSNSHPCRWPIECSIYHYVPK